jgi:hypothetical protein
MISRKFIRSILALGGALAAITSARASEPSAPVAPSVAEVTAPRIEVRLTELGLMRALLILGTGTQDMEPRVAQHFMDLDFRLFPSAQMGRSDRLTPAEAIARGREADADLVLFTTATSRQKTKLEDFELHEAEATVQLFNAVSGELLVSRTERATGTRTSDAVEAARGARERAVDAAETAAIRQTLDRTHRLLVYEAVIVGVYTEEQLLGLMDHMRSLDGVAGVRRRSFNRDAREALIEVIAAPRSEGVWRAHLEKMPKLIVNLGYNPNKDIRNKYPSWFSSSAAK